MLKPSFFSVDKPAAERYMQIAVANDMHNAAHMFYRVLLCYCLLTRYGILRASKQNATSTDSLFSSFVQFQGDYRRGCRGRRELQRSACENGSLCTNGIHHCPVSVHRLVIFRVGGEALLVIPSPPYQGFRLTFGSCRGRTRKATLV